MGVDEGETLPLLLPEAVGVTDGVLEGLLDGVPDPVPDGVPDGLPGVVVGAPEVSDGGPPGLFMLISPMQR